MKHIEFYLTNAVKITEWLTEELVGGGCCEAVVVVVVLLAEDSAFETVADTGTCAIFICQK